MGPGEVSFMAMAVRRKTGWFIIGSPIILKNVLRTRPSPVSF